MLGVLDLAMEFAIGKGASTTFAELHIGFRIKLAFFPQTESIPGALAHRLAALEYDRTQAHLRQNQPVKQPARPGADDYWA